MSWETIGVVGVDSGQLMITDPCYAKDFKDDGFPNEVFRVHVDAKTGKEYVFGKDFQQFTDELELDGETKTWNDWIQDKRIVDKKVEETGEYSYSGCCRATMGEKGGGQLNYALGHPGAGVAFASGYGDGQYEVRARKNSDGRIVEVRILMDLD